MRRTGMLAVCAGLAWAGLAAAEPCKPCKADCCDDKPRSLMEALGWGHKKKCCTPDCPPACPPDCPPSAPPACAPAPAAPCAPGYPTGPGYPTAQGCPTWPGAEHGAPCPGPYGPGYPGIYGHGGLPGQLPAPGYGPGYGPGAAPAPAPAGPGGPQSLFGHNLPKKAKPDGQWPSWAWKQKPEAPPPPPELYPGLMWHYYPRSPRDFFGNDQLRMEP